MQVGLVSAESSTETECSVDIVDLVYAEVSGETECLVDIVSGLVDTHSHMHVRTHTHTHTFEPLKVPLQGNDGGVLGRNPWTNGKVASYPGPLRGGERAWYTPFAHALTFP